MHEHGHNRSYQGMKIAFFLNLFFTIIEIAGGFYTNSISIISDAVHDMGDTLSLGAALLLEIISTAGRDNRSTYGYKRFSLLGALFTSIVLLAGSVYIFYEAIPRLARPEPVQSVGMMVLAVTGVVINFTAFMQLQGGKKISENLVMLHLLEDVLGWGAVLVVSILIHFNSGLIILDPILSVLITIYIISRIFPNLKNTLKVFMQFMPEGQDLQEIVKLVEGSSGHIRNVHDVHLWTLDGSYMIFSAHVVLDGNPDLVLVESIKSGIRARLRERGIEHVTLEVEHGNENAAGCDL